MHIHVGARYTALSCCGLNLSCEACLDFTKLSFKIQYPKKGMFCFLLSIPNEEY